MTALKNKQEKEKYKRDAQKQKERQIYLERMKKKREEEEASNRRIKIIGIGEVTLFGAILALHITISVIQRNYTGVYFALNTLFNQLIGEFSIATNVNFWLN
jgi:tartrate dehydratase alpha subunit/fumarate hydratase class I-like protein